MKKTRVPVTLTRGVLCVFVDRKFTFVVLYSDIDTWCVVCVCGQKINFSLYCILTDTWCVVCVCEQKIHFCFVVF